MLCKAWAILKTGLAEGKSPTLLAFIAERALRSGSSHAVETGHFASQSMSAYNIPPRQTRLGKVPALRRAVRL